MLASERDRQRLRHLLDRASTTVNTATASPVVEVSSECQVCPLSDDGERCELPDLCGQAVLCVGGRSGMTHHYRELVERCNGRFLHHDGGREDSPHRLKGGMGQADLVVCPAGYVSHVAYWQVKHYCKERGKPCAVLQSSGTTSWTDALYALIQSGQKGKGITVIGSVTARG